MTNEQSLKKVVKKAPFFEEELAGVIAETIKEAMLDFKDGKFNFKMKRVSNFVSKLLSNQEKKLLNEEMPKNTIPFKEIMTSDTTK